MRRTRIKMMAAVMAATMLLGGCGDALYDLTDDEENVIVNYAAHIVTKYNTYQREGLTYVSQRLQPLAALHTAEDQSLHGRALLSGTP